MRARAPIGGRHPPYRHLDPTLEPNSRRREEFGLIVPKGGGRIFESNIRALLEGQEALAGIVLPSLKTWRAARVQAAGFDRQLMAVSCASAGCRLMMTKTSPRGRAWRHSAWRGAAVLRTASIIIT
jgi:hypothetical protein